MRRITNLPRLDWYPSIAIVGRVGVGKTFLADELAKKYKLKAVHTDDFIDKCDFKDAPQFVMSHCRQLLKPYVVEGVQVSRMLRTGLRDKIWQPDIVLFVECTGMALEVQHRSLATLTQKAMTEWLEANKLQEHPVIMVDVITRQGH